MEVEGCISVKINYRVRAMYTKRVLTVVGGVGNDARPRNAPGTVHGADLPVPGQGARLVRPEAADGGRRAAQGSSCIAHRQLFVQHVFTLT